MGSSNFLISNFLSILKFASLKKLLFVYAPSSKLIIAISALIYDLGFIRGFTSVNSFYLKVYFKSFYASPALRSCFALSTPSRRCYFHHKSLYGARVNNFVSTNSFLIVSTACGLLTDVECSVYKMGGEPLFYVS